MPLKAITDKAVAQILETAPPLSDEAHARIAAIVEQAVLDSSVSTAQRCVHVVGAHLEHEEDKAHQLTDRLEQEQTALTANLMSMR
jgi:hypothetical protein